ncbi:MULTISPECIES: RNA polymerase sigma factor [Cryobacterium]|nr:MULTISPECIES: RNA polymerase sigma factor [Cryobacterium]
MNRRAGYAYAEQELLAKVQGGDVAAFEDLTRLHIRSVLRYASAVTRVRSDVEDVAQEVLLTAWRRRAGFSPERSMLPWLLVTTRNIALAANRRHARDAAESLDAVPLLQAWTQGQAQRDAADELAEVRGLIAGLSEIDQKLVELCFVQGRTFDDASSDLGLSPPAARKRIQRIRERLVAHRSTAPGLQTEN